MARPRLDLHGELLQILPYAYFNPPEAMELNYPCVVYHVEDIDLKHADNLIYSAMNRYQLTVISDDADDNYHELLMAHFRYISPGRPYVSDNLYHRPLTLYF